MGQREEIYGVMVAVLAAMLIAASNVSQTAGLPLLGAYAYWLVRVLIEAGLFILVRDAIEKHFAEPRSAIMVVGAAIVVSLVPFVLAITALDIVLGYPELGLENSRSVSVSRFAEFGLELIYLLDNHIALCLLLTVPRIIVGQVAGRTVSADLSSELRPSYSHESEGASIFETMEPPLEGDVLWAEAQEHYVRLTTPDETRMVLHRFSDILKDLPENAGVQVHRSHWVSFGAIAEAFKDGPNLRLRLQTGAIVPVSRSYRGTTEHALRQIQIMS